MVDSILISDRKTRYYEGIMMSMEEWDAADFLCRILEVGLSLSFLPLYNH